MFSCKIYVYDKKQNSKLKLRYMARLGVYLTDHKRIIVTSYASDLNLLLGNQAVKSQWFLNMPRELEAFLMQYPEYRRLFDKAFAYWVICRVFEKRQNENAYGLLKRELSEFSSKLLGTIRSLIKKAVNNIKSFFDKREKEVKKFFRKNNVPFPQKKSYQKSFLKQFEWFFKLAGYTRLFTYIKTFKHIGINIT